eukprot:gene6150-12460_t
MSQLLYFPQKQFSSRFGDKFFTFDIVDVSIVGHSCGGYHAVFNLEIYRGKSVWRIERRFQEFCKLNASIRRSNSHVKSELPPFPPKTCFRVLSKEFLDDRKEKLKMYLEAVLLIISRHELMLENHNGDLRKFLNINT